MISKTRVREFVEEKIAGSDKFIVDISVSSLNKISVFVDGDAGLTISDCKEISRYVESKLDREAEDFELEVSSPGADKPLTMPRQYMKNTGRSLDYLTTDGKKGTAKLLSADTKGVVFEEKNLMEINGKKKKQLVTQQINLNYEQIKEATIHLMF